MRSEPGPDPQANAPQQRASDPSSSAWVSANAGSGKTHVLVDRVVRLLLAGAEPSRIMCLTFTKAAAAEMANRLFERLSAWVIMDDGVLSKSLAGLGETDVDSGLLRRARRLFTRALETPGGLKIQTIHAFCERVLQAFPVEAGIVPRFSVLDERTSRDLLTAARDLVLAEALVDPMSELGQAAALMVRHAQPDAFDDILKRLLGQRETLHALIESEAAVDAAVLALRRALGMEDSETPESVKQSLSIDRQRYLALVDALMAGGATALQRADGLRESLALADCGLEDLRWLYLTDSDEPRRFGAVLVKKIKASSPWVEAFLTDEQARLVTGLGRLADFERLAASRALLVLGRAIAREFEAAKRRASAYDFDDLINRTRQLLATRPDARWVLYKLDGGIEHLLVDEAQDTSPAQWRIVEALTGEFFAGAGRHGGRLRTVFAVGDRKQSIFSFQGAEPAMFAAAHDTFGELARGAGQTLEDVALTVSFRSAPQILEAVDHVFAEGTLARQGLDVEHREIPPHTAHRSTARGIVELWPLIEPEEADEPDHWSVPVDREPLHSPRRRLAARIAQTVAAWIGRRRLASHDRAVRPGDILILVRKRDTLFDAIIRELRKRAVPVAGADRLKLAANLAVMDLMALAQAALMPEDDLALACVLKSPLLARPLSEDQLMALAIGRGSKTLWTALRASTDPVCGAASAELGRLAAIAPDARPFEFFAGVLVNARMRFLERLGSEANDALDALLSLALAFEQDHPSTLAGFLTWFQGGESEIKRNMEQGSGEVRIMTVHGAKGLEAPIVILPETTSIPERSEPVYMLELGNSGLKIPFWPPPRLFKSEALAAFKQSRRGEQHEEYHRLLYVAMTRPRDELYVCGCVGAKGLPEGCWYELARDGLAGLLEQRGEVLRMGADPEPMAEEAQGPLPPQDLPSWVAQLAAEESVAPAARTVSSMAVDGAASGSFSAAAASKGIAVHRMLELLAESAPESWPQVALRAAAAAGFGAELADLVLRLAALPLMRTVLGPGGLSEVPLLVNLPELGQTVTGRIDRLVLGEDRILAVDYKTGPRVPRDALEAEPSHLRQMALYRAALRRIHPGQAVDMALLYTEGPALIAVPPELLDELFDQIAVNRP